MSDQSQTGVQLVGDVVKNVSVKHGCVLLCIGIFIAIFLSATAPAMLLITLYAVKMINEV